MFVMSIQCECSLQPLRNKLFHCCLFLIFFMPSANINTMHHGFLKPTPTITNGPVDKVVFPTDHGGVTFLCDYSGGTGKVTWYFQPDNPISPSSWIAVGKPGFPAEAKQAGNGLGFDPSVPIKATSQGSYYCKVTVSHVGSVVSRPATLSLASK